MDLKELLGDAYKEGMTFDEVSGALSKMKLADLSTGNYVKKEMADADKARLVKEKEELEGQLNAKLTDDEKAVKIVEEKDKQIEKLMKQLKDNTISNNRSKLYSLTSETRAKLDIGDDNEEFSKFANLITVENNDDSSYISSYISKIMKNAYERGIEDAKKEQIVHNKMKQGGDASQAKDENYGTKIAKRNKQSSKATYNYFE